MAVGSRTTPTPRHATEWAVTWPRLHATGAENSSAQRVGLLQEPIDIWRARACLGELSCEELAPLTVARWLRRFARDVAATQRPEIGLARELQTCQGSNTCSGRYSCKYEYIASVCEHNP